MKKIILLVIILSTFISCDFSKYDSKRVSIKNNTTENITIYNISGLINDSKEKIILPSNTINLTKKSIDEGSISFYVLYKGQKYRTSSGYIDSFSAYTLRFTDNNNLNCILISENGNIEFECIIKSIE